MAGRKGCRREAERRKGAKMKKSGDATKCIREDSGGNALWSDPIDPLSADALFSAEGSDCVLQSGVCPMRLNVFTVGLGTTLTPSSLAERGSTTSFVRSQVLVGFLINVVH